MSKKLIRLTESDLHRIIKESIKNILNEGFKYSDFQEHEPSFTSNYWIDSEGNTRIGRLGLDDIDGIYNTKEEQMNHDWLDFDKKNRIEKMVAKDAMEAHPYRQKDMNPFNQNKHSINDYNTEDFFDNFSPSSKDEYMNSYEYPKKYDGYFNGHMDDIKNDFDNQWEKSKEIDKYTKQANSRPLHRKGSLNREF